MVSNDQANARVAIREVFQSAENASRISFPGHHRPAETKERAYLKGNFFRFGRDGDEEADAEAEDTETEVVAGDDTPDDSESVEEPLVVDGDDDDSEDDEDE
jgi:hypothetical protein